MHSLEEAIYAFIGEGESSTMDIRSQFRRRKHYHAALANLVASGQVLCRVVKHGGKGRPTTYYRQAPCAI